MKTTFFPTPSRTWMMLGLIALLSVVGCTSKKKEQPAVLNVEITDVQAKQEGELISIPVSSNMPLSEPTCSHDWVKATLSKDSTAVDLFVSMNITGESRSANVTITTNQAKEVRLSKSIKVSQNSLDVYKAFRFSQDEYILNFAEGSGQISLISKGSWTISKDTELPGWLELTPKAGKGDSYINLKYKGNVSTSERAVQIMFTNKELGVSTTLRIKQNGNSAGIYDFSHLGKGYDASGTYAEENFVKASVLDCDALYNEGHIADAINNNATTEETISGETRDEYMKNLATHAKVESKFCGFKGSMEANFSKESLSITENSFFTYKTYCKKQIIKIHENLKPSMLKECISEGFTDDMMNLSAAELVAKYGTHVITGLSLGGVLNYNLVTNHTVWKSDKDIYAAVKAGYKSEAFSVGGEASANYNEKELKEEGYLNDNFYCRGGESQYATGGIKRTYESYEKWLDSLKERNLWVMVDYEGNCLVPIYEFIFNNPRKQAEVRKYFEAYLSKDKLPRQESQTKYINVKLEKAYEHRGVVLNKVMVTLDQKETKLLAEDIFPVFNLAFLTHVFNEKLRMPFKINSRRSHVLTLTFDPKSSHYKHEFKYWPVENKWEYLYNGKLYSPGEKITIVGYFNPELPKKGYYLKLDFRILEEKK